MTSRGDAVEEVLEKSCPFGLTSFDISRFTGMSIKVVRNVLRAFIAEKKVKKWRVAQRGKVFYTLSKRGWQV